MGVRSARRAAQLMLAMLVAVAAWSCGGGNGGTTTPVDNGGTAQTSRRTVTGFVGDATSGAGIAGATVTIGTSTSSTAATGLFSIRDIERVAQQVTISAPGFITVTMTLAANVDQISLRLVPSGAGTIENPPGAPGV